MDLMSDMSAVEVIAGVLAGHRKSWYVQSGVATCTGCDWTRFGTISRTDEAHQKHLAAEVDKALGGLTREVSKGTRVCSLAGAEHEGMAHGHWIGGWTPEEAS